MKRRIQVGTIGQIIVILWLLIFSRWEVSGQKVDNATRERYLKLCNGLTATPLPMPFVFLGAERAQSWT